MNRTEIEKIKNRSQEALKRCSPRNSAEINHRHIIRLCEYIEQLEGILEEARSELESRCF